MVRPALGVGGGRASIEIDEGVAYLAMSIRNVGRGLAVLQGWHLRRGFPVDSAVDEFQLQTWDLYIPPDDIGFWQGAFRDRDDHWLRSPTRSPSESR